MGKPELLIPGIIESPAIEELGLACDIESLGCARDFMQKVSRDALLAVHEQIVARVEAIEEQRPSPLWISGYAPARIDADPLLGELANSARVKSTHFKWLLAKGDRYALYANAYGIPVTPYNCEGGLGYRGVNNGEFVEIEHTHNRHLIILRTYGAPYNARERFISEAEWTDAIITTEDHETWVEHRAQLAPNTSEYGEGAVYAMHADSTHALGGIVEGSPSLSLALELDPVRDFSTTFTPEGQINGHIFDKQRRFTSLIARLGEKS